MRDLQPGPDEQKPEPVVAGEDALEAARKSRPVHAHMRRAGEHDREPDEESESAERPAQPRLDGGEELVGARERELEDEGIQPGDGGLERARRGLALAAGPVARDGEEMVVLEPAQHLQRFLLGECLPAAIARELGEDRGDGARAVERAEEAQLAEAYAVKAAGVRILDHAHAPTAGLLDAEAQPIAQPRAQRIGLDHGTIFSGAHGVVHGRHGRARKEATACNRCEKGSAGASPAASGAPPLASDVVDALHSVSALPADASGEAPNAAGGVPALPLFTQTFARRLERPLSTRKAFPCLSVPSVDLVFTTAASPRRSPTAGGRGSR